MFFSARAAWREKYPKMEKKEDRAGADAGRRDAGGCTATTLHGHRARWCIYPMRCTIDLTLNCTCTHL